MCFVVIGSCDLAVCRGAAYERTVSANDDPQAKRRFTTRESLELVVDLLLAALDLLRVAALVLLLHRAGQLDRLLDQLPALSSYAGFLHFQGRRRRHPLRGFTLFFKITLLSR